MRGVEGTCAGEMKQNQMDALTQFGTYQIVRKIGAGGMADVYEAVRVGLENFQTRVALKCIQPSMTRDERFVKMFINEAHLGSQLHHPNIIQIQDFNKFNDTYYIAMEYVEGVDLSRIIKRLNARGISFPATVVIDLALQALAGLGHAHEARRGDGSPMNIIHRDVKPSNFLITASGMVKIGDFGIAKAANAAHNLGLTGDSLKGTINYMSPEQIDGVTLTPSSDLFGVAAIIFEMLTLRSLFDGPTMSSVLLKIAMVNIEGDLKLVSSRYPVFVPVLRRGLAREVRDRYSNASDFSADLRRLREELSEGLSLREFLAMHKDHLFAPYGTQPGEQEEKDGPLSIAVTPPDGIHRKTLSYSTGVEPGAFDLVAGDGMDGFKTDPDVSAGAFASVSSVGSSPWAEPVEESSGVLSVFDARLGEGSPWKDDLGSVAQELLPSDELDDGGLSQHTPVAVEETRVIPTRSTRAVPVMAVPVDDEFPVPVAAGRKPLLIGAALVSLGLLAAAIWVLGSGGPKPVGPGTLSGGVEGVGTGDSATVKEPAQAPAQAPVKAAQLTVQSTPPGARISVGGTALGALTPTTLPLPLDKSTVTIKLELAGYKTFVQDLPYQPGQELELKPSLVPGETSLTVSSTPAGAKIFFDQKATGKVTPFTFEKLSVGKPLLVAVRANGFEVYRAEVTLEDGIPGRVDASLHKGATAEGPEGMGDKPAPVEGSAKPTPPVKPVAAVEKPEPVKKPVVETSPPEPKPVKQSGEAGAPGELVLNTKPPDSEVWVDGKRLGEVPYTIRLNPGTHRIEFRPVNGSESKKTSVKLGAGERVRVLWDLANPEPIIRTQKLEP